MSDEVVLISSDSPARLRFYNPVPAKRESGLNYFSVELRDEGLVAAHPKVYGYMSNFAALFSEMATNWRGWTGEKHGGTLEGELSLRCTSDGRGHVFVEITLHSGPYEVDWTVKATLRLDAQQLIELDAHMQRFFRVNSGMV